MRTASLVTIGLAAAVGAAQGNKPRPTNPAIAERVASLLASAVEEDATRRWAVAERLADMGPPAVPVLEEALRRQNRHAVRTAVAALNDIGDAATGQALVRYFEEIRGRSDEAEIAVLAAYALGGCPGAYPAEVLGKICASPNEAEQVRAAAALGLGRRPDRDGAKILNAFTIVSKREDSDPETLGSLAIALARSGAKNATQRLTNALRDHKDPAARAGCWLGLAHLRSFGGNPLAAPDLASKDPVLTRCAILGSGDFPKGNDPSTPELREARVVALGLGAGGIDAFAFAKEETEPANRAAWYGAAAARGVASILIRPPWTEKDTGEWGRFAAAAEWALRGGFTAEERAELRDQARTAWQKRKDKAAALLLASLDDRDAAKELTFDERMPLDSAAAARVAGLYLRGELDRRRLEIATRQAAAEERVLPELWLSEASSRLAAAILGSGSQVFQRQSRLPFPPKLLLPPQMSRRKRTVPEEHPMYSDLWHVLTSSPFDVSLVLPRNEGG